MQNIFLSLIFLIPFLCRAQNLIIKTLDSEGKRPIENVYFYDREENILGFSDNNGKCIIYSHPQKVYFSHVGYIEDSLFIDYNNQKNFLSLEVTLRKKITELKEIIVTSKKLDPYEILDRAIEKIGTNYHNAFTDTLNLKLRLFFYNRITKKKLLDYKGNMNIIYDQGSFFGRKNKINIDESSEFLNEYPIEISPTMFYKIIPVSFHAVIRKKNKFNLKFDDIYNYKGEEVYKISFDLEKKCAGQTGYLLINSNDYSIISIQYTIKKCRKWIAATYKSKGLIYTNLEHYNVNSEYRKDIDKYRFSSGSINILFNMEKKKNIISQNSYDVKLNTIPYRKIEGEFFKLEDVFKK